MDGLAEDADVVFLLTTNRADVLEPALAAAARPGRPGGGAGAARTRRRAGALFELYRGALDVDESRLDAVLERTEGVTASFLKELLRRAALLRRGRGRRRRRAALAVSADQLDAALDELLDTRNAMTRVLLGGHRRAAVLEAADLLGPAARLRDLAGPHLGGLVVGHVHHGEPAEELLGLDVGPVGEHQRAAGRVGAEGPARPPPRARRRTRTRRRPSSRPRPPWRAARARGTTPRCGRRPTAG